jgi:general secretion pathway protein D
VPRREERTLWFGSRSLAALLVLIAWLGANVAFAQARQPAPAPAESSAEPEKPNGDEEVQLDFNDVELSVVIDTIARLTSKNFIYDDRVRGRVTIVSPSKITVDQAYAVFESVLQVKGFTTVVGPGGAIKVIPIREAKESSIETVRGATPKSDRFITRLIPLRFIDAEAITNTLKPLVSKDASMVAYAPTNTVILTDSASNIRRILDILGSIDVETYKEDLTVIQLEHADAATLAQQLSEIYGAEVTGASTPSRARTARSRRTATPAADTGSASKVRIVTDERTNSLIVLASRGEADKIRQLVARLDVPVTGGGRIHVYYLRNADAEELAETLNALISGQPAPAAGGGRAGVGAAAAPLRAAVTSLAEGITVTADPGTNALVIQASKEGFGTLSQVVEQLDIQRPQVLVEALIMEVDISDSQDLGFNGIARLVRGSTNYAFASVPGTPRLGNALAASGDDDDDDDDGGGDLAAAALGAAAAGNPLLTLLAAASRNTLEDRDGDGTPDSGSLIQGLITASAGNSDTEILSAPHILTTDNEEAEIKVGANIPIITSRVQSASGVATSGDNLATSVNVERQDIGVTLRVTPQISEGDNVRLEIFQEITNINQSLSRETGNPEDVGVSLSNRKVENTVVVSDEETVVIGGLISDDYNDSVSKVPWLGDIPFLGWLFKSTSRSLVKTNLLVFLTPHIVREASELEEQTIRKREEFHSRSREQWDLDEDEKLADQEHQELAEEMGLDTDQDRRDPVRFALRRHERRYPLERMREIEQGRQAEAERTGQTASPEDVPHYGILAAVFRDEAAAAETLTELVDAGYEGTLVSGESAGTVLFEVRLGPYETLKEAEEASTVVRRAFGLEPTVLVERAEP